MFYMFSISLKYVLLYRSPGLWTRAIWCLYVKYFTFLAIGNWFMQLHRNFKEINILEKVWKMKV